MQMCVDIIFRYSSVKDEVKATQQDEIKIIENYLPKACTKNVF